MPAICNVCYGKGYRCYGKGYRCYGKGYRYTNGYCADGDWDAHPVMVRCYDCGGHGVYRDEAVTAELPAVTMAELVSSS